MNYLKDMKKSLFYKKRKTLFKNSKKGIILVLITSFLILNLQLTDASTKHWDFIDERDFIFDKDKIEIIPGEGATLKITGNPDWYNNKWTYRSVISITIETTTGSIEGGTTGDPILDYQTKIELNDSNFDFSKAKNDGSDIIITKDDGITSLPYYIEFYDPVNEKAIIWVKLSQLEARNLYVYYGNEDAESQSNGKEVFDFFDDFSSPEINKGYFDLSEPIEESKLPAGGDGGEWEGTGPHTFSIIERNVGGYRYWGYYCSEEKSKEGEPTYHYVGLARSNDLKNWEKYSENPLFKDGRWPYVIESDSTIYMVYTENFGIGLASVHLRKSTDGINFEYVKPLVKEDSDSNGNPTLFYDNNSQKYYLYWFTSRGGKNYIKAREADNVEDLDTADDIILLESDPTLAAPQVIYYDDTYFLMTESIGGSWQSEAFEGPTPLGPFERVFNNPVLTHHSACAFQHIFKNTDFYDETLYLTYCYIPDKSEINVRVADLSLGRTMFVFPNDSLWNGLDGSWDVIEAERPDGNTGYLLQPNLKQHETKIINGKGFDGGDYIVETYVKFINSGCIGVVGRLHDDNKHYFVNFYQDLKAFHIYKNTGGSTVFSATKVINFNEWYKLTIKFLNGKETIEGKTVDKVDIEVYLDGEFQGSYSDVFSPDPDGNQPFLKGGVGLRAEHRDGGHSQYGSIFVRKYVENEPEVSVGSTNLAFPNNSPSIESKSPINLSSLASFTEDAAKNGGEIKYQLSNDDGATWYYFDNDWIVSDETENQATTASEINDNIESFPIDSESLLFRAFLISDGSQLVVLKSIEVSEKTESGEAVKRPSSIKIPTGKSVGQGYIYKAWGGEISEEFENGGYARISFSSSCIGETGIAKVRILNDEEIEKLLEDNPLIRSTLLNGTIADFSLFVGDKEVTKLNNTAIIYFNYLRSWVSESEEDFLRIYKWDAEKMEWIPLNSKIDKKNRMVFAEVNNLSLFALMKETTTVNDQIMNRIEEIKLRIAQLETKLKNLLLNEKESEEMKGCRLMTDLNQGDSGNDVRCLQLALKNQGKTIYPEGIVSGWFGPMTYNAVVRFQEEYFSEVLDPLNLSKGTGFVGSLTRQKINEIFER